MFNIVLVYPQIPPNTGNILRLCANTGCTLHLVEPMGFDVDIKDFCASTGALDVKLFRSAVSLCGTTLAQHGEILWPVSEGAMVDTMRK